MTRGPMAFDRTTQTAAQLEEAIAQARRHPHGDVHKGKLIIAQEAFQTSNRETNLAVSRFAILDCTGSIRLGPWCQIGARCRVYTHDHIHLGKRPLLEVAEEWGVLWQDIYIGALVWIHDAAIVLYQVICIPDGVVIGAGSVLTKNPEPYEIWAGAPARKVGERRSMDLDTIREIVARPGFSLENTLNPPIPPLAKGG